MAFDVGMVVRTYRIFSDEDLVRSLQHHGELVDAIAARAPDWAENVMAAHLLAGASKVAQWVDAKAAGAKAAGAKANDAKANGAGPADAGPAA